MKCTRREGGKKDLLRIKFITQEVPRGKRRSCNSCDDIFKTKDSTLSLVIIALFRHISQPTARRNFKDN